MKLLLNKLEGFEIKEEELFNPEKDIKSFKLLEFIQKSIICNKFKFEDFSKTKYIKTIFQIKDNMLKKISKGEINYNSFKNIIIAFGSEKRNIFKEKLRLLFFDNKDDYEESKKLLIKKFTATRLQIIYLERLNSILKKFFVIEHKNDIKKVEILHDLIKNGMLNEIEKQKIKKDIDEIHKISRLMISKK